MGKRAGGNGPPHFEKLRGGGQNSFASLFGIQFKKKKINSFTNTLVWKNIFSSYPRV